MTKPGPLKVPAGERGAALLTVLLLVAVMGAISAAALEKMRLSTATAVNSAATDQARAFAVGVESLIGLTIEDLTARSSDRTTLAGGWNGAIRQYPLPAGGFAEATIRDGGNCFNINSLAQGQNPLQLSANPFGIAQFTALMRLLEVPEGSARKIAEGAADWVDADTAPSGEGGEDPAYAGYEAPYRTGNTLFSGVSEIRALNGMTPEIYGRIRPWLCALPVAELSPLNVNTLSPDQAPLLAMLAPEQLPVDLVRRVLAERPAAGWQSALEFWQMPALEGILLPGEVQLQPQIRTDWFALGLKVALRGAELEENALIDARAKPVRIVSRRWGSDE